MLNLSLRRVTLALVSLSLLFASSHQAFADGNKPVIETYTVDGVEVQVIEVDPSDPIFKDPQTIEMNDNTSVQVDVEEPGPIDMSETESVKGKSAFRAGPAAIGFFVGGTFNAMMASGFLEHDVSKTWLVRATGGVGGCLPMNKSDNMLDAGFTVSAMAKFGPHARAGFGFNGNWCIDTGAPPKELVYDRLIGADLRAGLVFGPFSTTLGLGMGWNVEQIPENRMRSLKPTMTVDIALSL
ncbi:MAG: hypothetical protein KBC69_00310 [Candidatus Magasanikbacteria bacterium]|nr:hypothetical protein [Candidatus Magasanikbacteria bacterium]